MRSGSAPRALGWTGPWLERTVMPGAGAVVGPVWNLAAAKRSASASSAGVGVTASAADAPASRIDARPHAVVRLTSSLRLIPAEDAFAPSVDVRDEEDQDEDAHRNE